MTVKRIVTNIAAEDVTAAHSFYRDLLGLEILMDLGWIATYGSAQNAPVQISIASEGGSGTEVPDISIEVDDIDETYRRARAAGFEITYELTDEPWNVRRFYVRDPLGKLINIMAHSK
ncbi:VOC family protein [Denitrobaculum tricleocarpae]|uniref:Glyoxalase n=1 Tax=Denitrobaculum tricleocarpae TaxID=2591009 RepID=A0A545TEN9_9PROT|nr:VOC family protein [Denitrobaculum tricleocarpae]TQV75684.1 glyoxalase [Denitrobaculum tricleocarpae]